VVEVFALERVGDDGFVLDADLIAKAARRQRLNRPFELPRRRVRRGKREVPGNVVLQNRRPAPSERVRRTAELDEPIDVLEDGFWSDANDCNCGFGHA